jgi:hypothetical protein
VLALYLAGSLMGQLQQSGGPGSTVTIGAALPAGSALIGKVGIDQTTAGTTNAISDAFIGTTAIASGNGLSGAGVQRVNIASDNTAFAVNAAISAAIPAGANVIGTVNTIPKTSCGNAVAGGSTLAAVPTSPALITSAATACVIAIIVNNTNAAAATVTITDNTGTPINDVLTFSIPPFSQLIQPLYGAAFNLGVKWTASTTGLTGALVAYQ